MTMCKYTTLLSQAGKEGHPRRCHPGFEPGMVCGRLLLNQLDQSAIMAPFALQSFLQLFLITLLGYVAWFRQN